MQAREVAARGHAAGNQDPDGSRGLLDRAQPHGDAVRDPGEQGSYPSSQSATAPLPEEEEGSTGIARSTGDYPLGLGASAAHSQIRSRCVISLWQLYSRKSPTLSTSEKELLRKQARKGFHITGAKRGPQAKYGPQTCFMGSTHCFF